MMVATVIACECGWRSNQFIAMHRRRTLVLAALIAALTRLATDALGGAYVYNLGDVLKGSTPASPSTPWLTAEFVDIAPGQVQMTFTASNLASRESLGGLLLNLDPSLNPCLLVFDRINSSGSFRRPRISTGANAFRAGHAGSFDLRFQFRGGPGSRRQFGEGDQVTYLVSGIDGLTAASFGFPSYVRHYQDPLFAIAKVNGIGPCDATGWIFPADGLTPVPEPSVPLLLGSVLATFGALRLLGRHCR